MSREGFTTISAWDRTVRLIDQYRARLARERGLPQGKEVSRAEAIDLAMRKALEAKA